MTISVVDAGPHKVSRSADISAPAAELFALLADPHQHGDLDGSGTVVETVRGPQRLALGEKFSVRMKQHGVPYRITSRVTDFDDGKVVEWRHPLGHRWRWEFQPQSDGSTLVTETFDYSHVNPVQAKALELFGMPKQNAAGIDATLTKLQSRFSASA
jgi:uncharacterized protein YndB with AHSA1/START domain